MRAMRHARQLDLLLGAVRPDWQGRGVTCILATRLMARARARGFGWLDSHLVLESNGRMRAELERLGALPWKRYRVYAKRL
jgi:GNAT superfamily N-acetyltransferase